MDPKSIFINENWLWEKQGKRSSTLKAAYLALRSKTSINILELGTTRSFKSTIIDCENYDDNPTNWDWGAGCFTYSILSLLPQCKLTTVDNSSEAIAVSKKMCSDFDNRASFIISSSSKFLRDVDAKYDLVYMDHGESKRMNDECPILHLNDTKILLGRDLIAKDGLILIDDVNVEFPKISKGLYSIPLLKAMKYVEVSSGKNYQALLKNRNVKLTAG